MAYRQRNKSSSYLAFYASDDETFIAIYKDVKEVVKAMGLDINRKNMNYVSVNIYRALRRKTHWTTIFGPLYRVYLIDIEDEEE